jgi:hypothetical protein
MKTVIKADKHEMTLDEPKSVGGTDEGPSPFHAVLGALAGCEQATGKRPEPSRQATPNAGRRWVAVGHSALPDQEQDV